MHTKSIQMAENVTDTSLRIDRKTRESLWWIAQRAELPLKSCVGLMAAFIVKNRVTLKEEYIPVGKEVERVIRIVRAHEKEYFVPADPVAADNPFSGRAPDGGGDRRQ
mgnify:CR=1 FL=1